MSSTHGLKRFLQNHRRSISLAGVFLVFITFVAREGLAERWKDEANAIDLARDVYSIKSDFQEVLEKIGELSMKVSASSKADTPTSAYAWASKGTELLTQPRIQGIRVTSANIVALLGRLPADAAEAEELKNIKAEMEKSGHDFGKLFNPYAGKGAPAEISEAEAHELYTKELPLVQNLFVLSVKLDDVFRRVMSRAEETRKEIERKSRAAWWLAAVFWTIGLILAAVGRIYEVPVGEAA